MKRFLDFASTAGGFYLVLIFGLFIICSIFTGGNITFKYLNYQNTLDKVMDCRKTVGTTASAHVEYVCGDIPKWKDYQ